MGRGEQAQQNGAALLLGKRRSSGSGIAAYYAYGLRPAEARAYFDAGVDPRRARDLARHGIGAEHARAALASELDLSELGAWLAAGFAADEAGDWRRAGFTLAEAQQWRWALRDEELFKSVREAFPRLLPGGDIEALGYWKAHGIGDPRELLGQLAQLAGRDSDRPQIESPAAWLRAFVVCGDARTATALEPYPQRLGLYRELEAAGFSRDEAGHLARSGIPAGIACAWREQDPDLDEDRIRELHELCFVPADYPRWRELVPADTATIMVAFAEAGISDPEEGGEWLELARDPANHKFFAEQGLAGALEAGVAAEQAQRVISEYGQSPLALVLNAHQGVGPEEYFAWQEREETRGFSDYSGLKRIGLTPRMAQMVPVYPEAYTFPGSKLLSEEALDDLKELVEQGADPEQVAELHRIVAQRISSSELGMHAYEPISDLHRTMRERDLTPAQLSDWLEALGRHSSVMGADYEIYEWDRRGLCPEDAREWCTAETIEAVGRQRLAGFAAKALGAGLDHNQALSWWCNGFGPTDAAEWIKAGVRDPATASALDEHDVAPGRLEKLEPYLAAGFSAEQALSWLESEISAEEAGEWRRGGITDGHVAAEWLAAGIDPEQAARYERARRESGS